jgi:hypothetical protein
MKYDYKYMHKGVEHTSARIYPEDHLDLCLKHAKDHSGKVRCRETGKIIFDFCKSKDKGAIVLDEVSEWQIKNFNPGRKDNVNKKN